MESPEDSQFQETIEWAASVKNKLGAKTDNFPYFYVMIGAVVVFILLILFFYVISDRNTDKTQNNQPLKLMKESQAKEHTTVVDTPLNLNNNTVLPDGEYEIIEEYIDG